MSIIEWPFESALYLGYYCLTMLPQRHEILLLLKEVCASLLYDDMDSDQSSVPSMAETQCIHGYCGCCDRFEFSLEVKTICAW